MKKVLVLGAGMVSRPLVRYLMDRGFEVTVASRTVSKAERLVEGHENGRAIALNVKDEERLEALIEEADLSVSLLPYVFHTKVARYCIKHGKHMVTTSYVSDEMKSLDKEAKERGVLLLNEIGLDPGIDHMSAMRIIHDVQARDGRIVSFQSCCGALPSHGSNTNPFGYKFSWAPRGVLLASRNAARYRMMGKVVEIPGEELFEHYTLKTVPGVGEFENYPNRNSLPYAQLYGISDAETVYRGTFRFVGWSETMRALAKLGYLDDGENLDIRGKTYREVLQRIVGGGDDIIGGLAEFLKMPRYAAVLKRLEWLGLASHDPIPEDAKSLLDILAVKMFKKLSLREGDVDMCVLFHEFIAEFPNGEKEYITSTLVDYGQPGGDTAIARTVSLPAAISVRMILEGKIDLTGVHIPVASEIYDPVLNELENIGIKCVESTSSLPENLSMSPPYP